MSAVLPAHPHSFPVLSCEHLRKVTLQYSLLKSTYRRVIPARFFLVPVALTHSLNSLIPVFILHDARVCINVYISLGHKITWKTKIIYIGICMIYIGRDSTEYTVQYEVYTPALCRTEQNRTSPIGIYYDNTHIQLKAKAKAKKGGGSR